MGSEQIRASAEFSQLDLKAKLQALETIWSDLSLRKRFLKKTSDDDDVTAHIFIGLVFQLALNSFYILLYSSIGFTVPIYYTVWSIQIWKKFL